MVYGLGCVGGLCVVACLLLVVYCEFWGGGLVTAAS